MKALVVGASGQLGSALLALLQARGIPAVGTYCSHPRQGSAVLDLRDREAVRRSFAGLEPDLVFLTQNAPGGVDFCEDHPDQAAAVLVGGTRHVLEAAAPRRAKVVLFSSDYVFDGESGPYAEEAPPSPISVYGDAKLAAEEAVQAYPHGFLIARTTAVFSWSPGTKNIAMQIHERLGSRQAFRAPNDQWCNPTLAEHLAAACLDLALSDARGTFNVVGRDWMPRYEMAAALARAMSLDASLIQSVATSELRQRARRPLKGGLTTDKLRRALGVEPPTMEESLRRFSAKFRQEVTHA
ncbi:MAG: SDR family oxidoreductase [Elusimicrobia bacterium]|jgi:dTDP-4-dehydrorhamnose reductase|nr:SDR family oxidoreductase [Elusimicrobiota bacterium]